MTINRLLARFALLFLCVVFTQIAFSQTKLITGKILDDKGSPVQGATVTAKGSKSGTSTDAAGAFSLNVPAGVKTLVVSSVGFTQQEVNIADKSSVSVSLVSSTQSLTDVVVVGYGTSRKKDLTGAVVSVQAKDFNQGIVASPDQLLEGKVAGLEIITSSGQPGGATVVKIRGNNSIRTGNTPLYVIDGVPLDGRSPRPGFAPSGLGTTPDGNPLTFISPSDIASVDVLKDASSAAIYGSRGANGVILITTKKGQTGGPKLEGGVSYGLSGIMRNIKMLDATGYRSALQKFGAKSDSGASIDPFKAILRSNANTQNYNISLSGGTENGKYHASFLASDQQGILLKSGLEKYVANFNGQYKFLDKRLSLDFNVTAANVAETVAPISQDAGSAGNIISLALIWNPTLRLVNPDGTYNQTNPSGQVNPLALSAAYNDHRNVTTVLASTSLAYKILPDLEYKLLYGLNYGLGSQLGEIQGWIKATGGNADGHGLAGVNAQTLTSQTITHTLSYNKKITSDLNLNAVAGYEYWTTSYYGNGTTVYGFDYNLNQQNLLGVHYYDNLQDGSQANLNTFSFKDPTVDIQSYFGRVVLNYQDRFLLTGTLRADGSSKFGVNHKYGYFPSVAGAWNITNENFMKDNKIFNSLKLRVGYGQTGNQEFAPDASVDVFQYGSNGSISRLHYGNPDLKWETVSSTDIGLDFSILNGRVTGFLDYFNKKTTDPIYLNTISEPTAGGTVYQNLNGYITNKGFEFALNAGIIEKKDFSWNIQTNFSFFKNNFVYPVAGKLPLTFTGALHGQGSSGAYSEAIANNHPVDVFYLPQFQGFGSNGIGKYSTAPIYAGDPNPSLYYGITTDVNYKKFSLIINTHGSTGNKIFNNTAMSVTNISNIIGGRNIAANLVNSGEATANAITPSTRFLESGNYFKLGGATIRYSAGNISYFKNVTIYLTGTNLFVISKYTGFDPEVNVNKALNGVPSLGIDYIGFPSARTFSLGLNFSL